MQQELVLTRKQAQILIETVQQPVVTEGMIGGISSLKTSAHGKVISQKSEEC